MAKKAMLSLAEQIAQAEKYVLLDLYPRFKSDSERYQAELNTSLDNLSNLYQQRDQSEFTATVDFDRLVLDGLTVAQQINLVEFEALGLHNAYLRGQQNGPAAWQLATIKAAMDQRLDFLNEELYVLRWQERLLANMPPASTVIGTADRKYLGPEKLNGRRNDTTRQERKNRKSSQDQAIRSAMKGGENGSAKPEPKPKSGKKNRQAA